MNKIGIIGGGNGGISLYCDFLLNNKDVTLYYNKNFSKTISSIISNQEIIFKKENLPSRVINELNFTNDLVELIKNNDIILILAC